MINSFTDPSGRVWQIPIDIPTIKRVRAEINFDLLKLDLGKLTSDYITTFELVCCIIKPQLAAAGLTAENIGSNMRCESLDGAIMAIVHGVAELLPKDRGDLLLKAYDQLVDAQRQAIPLMIAELSKPLDVKTMITTMLGNKLPDTAN